MDVADPPCLWSPPPIAPIKALEDDQIIATPRIQVRKMMKKKRPLKASGIGKTPTAKQPEEEGVPMHDSKPTPLQHAQEVHTEDYSQAYAVQVPDGHIAPADEQDFKTTSPPMSDGIACHESASTVTGTTPTPVAELLEEDVQPLETCMSPHSPLDPDEPVYGLEQEPQEIATDLPRDDSSLVLWEAFVSRRPLLLQDAFADSVQSGSFNNVEIYAYKKRSTGTSVHTPAVIHARESFLEAATPVLKEALKNDRRSLRLVPLVSYEYDYQEDSDLEDEDDQAASELSELASNVSAFDMLDTPSVNSVNIAIPGTDESPLANADTKEAERDETSPGSEVIFAPYAAAKTWQALIMYLYNDRVSFAPLRSIRKDSSTSAKVVTCSPKSMYRLATRLQLVELANLSRDAILADLSPSNIVGELFSDFAWRYPEILEGEIAFFLKHSQEARVRECLRQAFREVGSGKLPHGHIVLAALFEHMLPPV